MLSLLLLRTELPITRINLLRTIREHLLLNKPNNSFLDYLT
jgi:hypothetical protein